jgi:hypothetical protein
MNCHIWTTIPINRTIIIFLVLMTTSSVFAFDGPPKGVEWQLSETTAISWGILSRTSEGEIRSGIKIEGKAVAQSSDNTFSEGAFTVTLTAFAPYEDMPGQKKGNWYLSGNWSITATGTDPTSHPSPTSVLTGTLKASLAYDPAVETGPMAAELRLQHRGVSVRAGRMSKGSYSGKSNFEGRLTTCIPSSLLKGVSAR